MGVYVQNQRFWISYTPTKGAKRVRESTNVPASAENGRAEAEAILAQVKLRAREQQWFPDSLEDCTVSQLKDLWFSRERTKKKKSLVDDRQRFSVLEKQLGKDTKVSTLRPIHVVQLKERLEGKRLKQGTVNRYLGLLRAALRWAKVQQKQVPESLLMSIQTPTENNQREGVFTREDYEKVITYLGKMKNKETRLAVIIGYWSGMRLGEIANLEWKEIDLEEGFIELRREKTKTNQSRVVPLHPVVIGELKAWPRREGDDRVFQGTPNTMSTNFGFHRKRMGLDGLVFHSLRHTALSNLSEAGVDLAVLKGISGHKTTAVLMRYVHPSRESLKKAIQKL